MQRELEAWGSVRSLFLFSNTDEGLCSLKCKCFSPTFTCGQMVSQRVIAELTSTKHGVETEAYPFQKPLHNITSPSRQ